MVVFQATAVDEEMRFDLHDARVAGCSVLRLIPTCMYTEPPLQKFVNQNWSALRYLPARALDHASERGNFGLEYFSLTKSDAEATSVNRSHTHRSGLGHLFACIREQHR